jgi:hypothetical protein
MSEESLRGKEKSGIIRVAFTGRAQIHVMTGVLASSEKEFGIGFIVESKRWIFTSNQKTESRLLTENNKSEGLSLKLMSESAR